MYVGVYNSIVKDLLEVGRFKAYKNMTLKIPRDQKLDIYFGVYLPYMKPPVKINDGSMHLFETFEDWWKVHSSVLYTEIMIKDLNKIK